MCLEGQSRRSVPAGQGGKRLKFSMKEDRGHRLAGLTRMGHRRAQNTVAACGPGRVPGTTAWQSRERPGGGYSGAERGQFWAVRVTRAGAGGRDPVATGRRVRRVATTITVLVMKGHRNGGPECPLPGELDVHQSVIRAQVMPFVCPECAP